MESTFHKRAHQNLRGPGLQLNLNCLSALASTPMEAVMARYLQWSRAVALAALVLGSPAAFAHDWYPLACCSDRDCHALVEERGETVTEITEGWKLWDGRIIRRSLVQLSPHQRFLSMHAAIYNTFTVPRHLTTARTHRLLRAEAFAMWREAAGVVA